MTTSYQPINKLPDISIITINYNGIKDTCELAESLQKYVSTTFELIIVDNGSKQNEAALLRERYPQHKIIRSEKNLGFAGGNNVGIHEAKGKYILLLNNDTYIREDTLKFLCETLDHNPAAGAVSPKIKFADSPQNIQFAGFTPMSKYSLRNHAIGFNDADNGQYNVSRPTSFLHGAAMMVKREVINEIGQMPEIFFLYYEEMDWCSNILNAGYQLWYDPRCTVYHKESRTTGQNSPLKTYYLTRNRLLYTWRQRKGNVLFIALLYQLCIANPKNIIVHLLQGEIRQINAILKGAIDFCTLKNKRI